LRFEFKQDEISVIVTTFDLIWEHINILTNKGSRTKMIIPLTIEMLIKKIRKYGKYDYFENQVLTQIEGDIEKMKEKTRTIGFQPPFGEENHIEDEEINIEKIIDQKLADFKHELLKELISNNQ